ncbi:hypothetical protein LOTGIDRAFT_176639, partial [Lottia gigantea]
GAAFGFSTIAAQAGEQLAPFLPQMVPKLYRYQFDPNPKIQQAMSSIWNALVKDNKKTVREITCLAVNDLLRGRNIDDIIEQLPELWQTLLRVRDDIKESVRTAAHTACKTLSRVSVKICDINNGKVGERAIQSVLPCLLTNTLNSTVKEVRQIGLSTILDISKNSGKLLKPHIPVEAISNEMLNNQPAIHQITDCVLKECRKEKSDYRLEAWKCMSAVLEEYEIDKFQDMWDIMIPVLQKVNLNQCDNKEKDDDEAISSNLKESNRECIYLCLGQCWPYTSSVQDDYKKKLLDLLLSSLPLSTWKVQVSILKSLNTYIERLHVLQKDKIRSTVR